MNTQMNKQIISSARMLLGALLVGGLAHANSDPLTVSYNKPLYEPGETFTITIQGEPGTIPFIMLDTDPGPTVIAGLGSVDLGLSADFISIRIPRLDANGTFIGSCDLGCEMAGMTLYTQVLGINVDKAEFCLSNSTTLNFADSVGECVPCSSVIGDYVWEDSDEDGIQDDDELGIAGVTVVLKNVADAVIATTMTDMNGGYLFSGICPGTYTVEVDPSTVPAGMVPTDCGVGGDDSVDSNCDPATVVIVNDGDSDLTIDFGFFQPNDCDLGKPAILGFTYTGNDCSATVQSQTDTFFSCVDFGALSDPVHIVVFNQQGQVYFENDVLAGDSFVVDASVAGLNNLKANTYVEISDQNGNVLQAISFHTSCSQPLAVGNIFGSLNLDTYTPELK